MLTAACGEEGRFPLVKSVISSIENADTVKNMCVMRCPMCVKSSLLCFGGLALDDLAPPWMRLKSTNTTDAGRLTSPLFSQEREVSADPFGFSSSQTHASAEKSRRDPHVPSRDSWLQPDTRNSLGTSGHVIDGLLARGEPSSALYENSKNLASSSCRLRPIDTSKIAEQEEGLRRKRRIIQVPTPRFARNFATWNPHKLYDGKSEEADLGPTFR